MLATAAALIALDFGLFGTWWGWPLGAFVRVWMVYWSLHLGGSFVLAALIATPGCEMRAVPHLTSLITGHAAKEHYCPGFIDPLDRWERRWSRGT